MRSTAEAGATWRHHCGQITDKRCCENTQGTANQNPSIPLSYPGKRSTYMWFLSLAPSPSEIRPLLPSVPLSYRYSRVSKYQRQVLLCPGNRKNRHLRAISPPHGHTPPSQNCPQRSESGQKSLRKTTRKFLSAETNSSLLLPNIDRKKKSLQTSRKSQVATSCCMLTRSNLQS